MKGLIYLKNVATLRIDADRCTGCGICLEVCPHGVLEIADKRVRILNRDACMECGACSRNCPAGAVSVESGVGCAAAVINTMLNRQNGDCCCSIDPKGTPVCKEGQNRCC